MFILVWVSVSEWITKLLPSSSYCLRHIWRKKVKVKSLSPVRLCEPVDCSPPGSSVRGILQARTLEWGAIPSPGDLPDPGIEPGAPALEADTLPSEPPGKPRSEAHLNNLMNYDVVHPSELWSSFREEIAALHMSVTSDGDSLNWEFLWTQKLLVLLNQVHLERKSSCKCSQCSR